MSSGPINSRRRLGVEERRRQIAEVGGELVARYGSYGVSMQAVADAVGLSLPGLLHHVRGRDELLALIVTAHYDDEGLSPALDGEAALSLPATLRGIVDRNLERPSLVALFVRLAVEAHDPAHPAHAYYRERHGTMLDRLRALPWSLPERFRDDGALLDLLRTALCAMDGAQAQSLTDPAEGLESLWSRVERTLFGAPEWDGYR